ncbi:MAG: PEP-CTERM sorting domain-containing protein [Bryobacterales bacterium]|nr:PEP-CTERM sorting domain-containing protein [Bryobacterales bacterium]
MTHVRTVLLSSLLLLTFVPLHGATIFSQPFSSNGNRVSSTLNFFGAAPGFQTYDDFTLATDASVTGLTWWGSQQSGGTDFSVTFYEGGATPGAVLATYSVSPTVQADPGPPANLLLYTASLNSPFSAVGGTQYWMSVFNGAADASWAWQSSSPSGGLIRELGANSFGETVGVAFTLTDSAVPEPSTGLLLGLGMMLVAGRGWSRRRKG